MNVLLTEIRALSPDPSGPPAAAGDSAGEFTRLLRRELQDAGEKQFQGIDFKRIYPGFEELPAIPSEASGAPPGDASREHPAPDPAGGAEFLIETSAAAAFVSAPQPPLPAALPSTGEVMPPGGTALPQAGTPQSWTPTVLSAELTSGVARTHPADSAPRAAEAGQIAPPPASAVIDRAVVAAPVTTAAQHSAPGAERMEPAPAGAGTAIDDRGGLAKAAANHPVATAVPPARDAANPIRLRAAAPDPGQAVTGPVANDRTASARAAPNPLFGVTSPERVHAAIGEPVPTAPRQSAENAAARTGATERPAPVPAATVLTPASNASMTLPTTPAPSPRLGADVDAASDSLARILAPARVESVLDNPAPAAARTTPDAALMRAPAVPPAAPASVPEAREPGMPQLLKTSVDGTPPEAIPARAPDTPVNTAPAPQLAVTGAPQATAPGNGFAPASLNPPALHLEAMTLSRQADSGEWGNGLGERVQYLINQKHNSATIRLDPPALGKLDVQVRISDDATTITIHTQHAQARDLIDSASWRLREFLQESGYQNVNVDVSQRQDQQQSRGQAVTDDGTRQAEDDRAEPDSSGTAQARQHPVLEGNGLLDTFA